MKRINAAILKREEEQLLALSQWFNRNSSGETSFLEKALEHGLSEKIRKQHPTLNEDEVCDRVLEQARDFIWSSVPGCDLQHLYDDYWHLILENWLQDGWGQFSDAADGDGAVEDLLEVMERTRVNEDVWQADQPADS